MILLSGFDRETYEPAENRHLSPDTVTVVVTTLAWVGDGEQRMEVAHVQRVDGGLLARGTQLGVSYELRYMLRADVLSLEVVGDRELDVALHGADFFDLGFSPLFNSLPVLRDRLLVPGPPRDYLMRWVDVPSLTVHASEQRYEPLGDRLVRFSADDFRADIAFDEAGFVLNYPGIGVRAGG